MANIFISYRRDDSQNIADRIFDHLSRDFDRKKLFKDVDNIPIGTNFRDYLAKAVAKTDIMLAIIGPSWAAQGADGRRRLDDPNDFIALEVASALKLGRPVVPVLVGGAQMPRPDELPEPLKELSVINAVQVRPDPDFIKDYQRLSKALKAIATQSSGKVTPVRRVISRAAGVIALIAAVATVYVLWQQMHAPSTSEATIATQPVAAPPATKTLETGQSDQPPAGKKNCRSYSFTDASKSPPLVVKRWDCE